jgi:hypothetical protein
VAGQGNDCGYCHLRREDGHLSHMYKRLGNDDYDALMTIYHDNCIECHQTVPADKSAPLTCGGCHLEKPLYQPALAPFYMDLSLHYRHIAETDNCGVCHHQVDEATGRLVYIEGQEANCRDCHHDGSAADGISYRAAAHEQCIECHLHSNIEPLTCAGCHDEQQQARIKRVENVPRLERGQPDFTLLAAAAHERSESKLNTVPFSHVGHEGFVGDCRTCHHQSMKGCTDCHNLAGMPAGGQVPLQQAMHDMNSNHSCVGCHEIQKATSECAGCHDLMEQGRLSEHACNICHAGPPPENLEVEAGKYTSLADFKPKPADFRLTFSDEEIPEYVTIGVLADQYEPATFPHRAIVDALMEHIADNRIATHFHGHEDVVCQGCHHHSPIGAKPPLCENCHGEPFNEDYLTRPGLLGAYHRQCLGCHMSMGIGDSEDCTTCHAKRVAGSWCFAGNRRRSNTWIRPNENYLS